MNKFTANQLTWLDKLKTTQIHGYQLWCKGKMSALGVACEALKIPFINRSECREYRFLNVKKNNKTSLIEFKDYKMLNLYSPTGSFKIMTSFADSLNFTFNSITSLGSKSDITNAGLYALLSDYPWMFFSNFDAPNNYSEILKNITIETYLP